MTTRHRKLSALPNLLMTKVVNNPDNPTWYDVDDADALARLNVELAQASPNVAPHTQAFFASNKEILATIQTNQ